MIFSNKRLTSGSALSAVCGVYSVNIDGIFIQF
jgi:hypothetical protein